MCRHGGEPRASDDDRPGQGAVRRGRNGKTEDVRRLLAEKAPLEYNKAAAPRAECATALTAKAQPAARHTRSLSLWQKAARRGLERRRRTRAGRPLPLPLPPPLSRARSLSLALTPCASLSHKCVQCACCGRMAGGTPLIIAAYNGHEAIVRLLLEAGADKEAKDNDGFTPLINAAYNGHEAVVRLLLEAGADKEAKDNDGDPLIIAAMSGHEAIVRLLEAGADKDAKDKNGHTPLLEAAARGHEAIVRLLLEAGANKEAKR